MEIVHNRATSLQSQSQSALKTINGLNVQQYINTNINPLLFRCSNYTNEAKSLLKKSKLANSQATLSLSTANNLATTTTRFSSTVAVIPTIQMDRMSAIYGNMLRVKTAYSALNIINDLANFKQQIEANRLKILNHRAKIKYFKEQIASYSTMHDSLKTLTCNVPSQIP